MKNDGIQFRAGRVDHDGTVIIEVTYCPRLVQHMTHRNFSIVRQFGLAFKKSGENGGQAIV